MVEISKTVTITAARLPGSSHHLQITYGFKGDLNDEELVCLNFEYSEDTVDSGICPIAGLEPLVKSENDCQLTQPPSEIQSF